MHTVPAATRKIVPLESMRGLAAFMVFLFHFVLGFMPQRHGQEFQTAIPGGTLIETPLFFLINGHAAVTFFFVLSGFVLSYGYFSKGSNDGLFGSVMKRWPRLFPMALISTLFSWLLIKYELYSYLESAAITESRWMGRFAHASGDFLSSTATDAFMQGFFYSFFRGDNNLNTSLWTMNHEFIGSLLVFGLIPILNGIRVRSAIILFGMSLLVVVYANVYMCAFIMGCFLSYYRCQVRGATLGWSSNRFGFAVGMAFVMLTFGFVEPGRGFYSFAQIASAETMESIRIVLHSVAAMVLIQMILNYKGLYRRLDGHIGRFLGRCSFALYVIHVPLMLSLSTSVFVLTLEVVGYPWAVGITFVTTVPILFLVSWLMTLCDEYWCRHLNGALKKMV